VRACVQPLLLLLLLLLLAMPRRRSNRHAAASRVWRPGPGAGVLATVFSDPPNYSAMRVYAPRGPDWVPSADLQRRLDGRHTVECGGGGSCLYHVLSFLLLGRPDYHVELRKAAADFYRNPANAQHELYRRMQEEIDIGVPIEGVQYSSVFSFGDAIERRSPPLFGSIRHELPVLADLLNLQVDLVLQVEAQADSAAADQFRGQRVGDGRLVSMIFLNDVRAQRCSTRHARSAR